MKKLYKSRHDRKIAGVCGGLANYFKVDPTLVRVITLGGIIITGGVGLLAYIACAVIIPDEPSGHN